MALETCWPAILTGAAVLGAIVGVCVKGPAPAFGPDGRSQASIRHFGLCHSGGGINCVVDGDTVWMDGINSRVADIDAPKTHPPRCPDEAALGRRATRRLQELLNAGPVVASIESRAQDRYGRQLRVLRRDGQSLGAILTTEGIARPWDGARHPWC